MKFLVVLLLVGAAAALPTEPNLGRITDDDISRGKRSADLEDLEARFVGLVGEGPSTTDKVLLALGDVFGRSEPNLGRITDGDFSRGKRSADLEDLEARFVGLVGEGPSTTDKVLLALGDVFGRSEPNLGSLTDDDFSKLRTVFRGKRSADLDERAGSEKYVLDLSSITEDSLSKLRSLYLGKRSADLEERTGSEKYVLDLSSITEDSLSKLRSLYLGKRSADLEERTGSEKYVLDLSSITEDSLSKLRSLYLGKRSADLEERTGSEKYVLDLSSITEDSLSKLRTLYLGKRSADLEDVEARFVGNIGDGDNMMSMIMAYLSAAADLLGRSKEETKTIELEKRAEPQDPEAASSKESANPWEKFIKKVVGPMADKFGQKLAETLQKHHVI